SGTPKNSRSTPTGPPRRSPISSKLNFDDHLSGILPAKHTEERFNAVLDPVDDSLVVYEFVLGKPLAHHLLEFLVGFSSMIRHDETLHSKFLTENIRHVIGSRLWLGGIVLSDRPTDCDSSKRCQHIECGFKMVTTDIIEIHVKSIVADPPVDLVSNRFLLVIEC